MRAVVIITVDRTKMSIETSGVDNKDSLLTMLNEAWKMVAKMEPKIRKAKGNGTRDISG